jgi:hypothetical protein
VVKHLAKSPDGAEVDRVVGRHGIKLLPRRPVPFGEDVRYVEVEWRIADRHGYHPLTGLFEAGKLGNPVLNVMDRAYSPKRRKDVPQRFPVHVGMTVGKTGNDGLALEINHPRSRANMRGHRIV